MCAFRHFSNWFFVFFFFKQKTAYEMRISDWSSDVCSSDLKTRSGKIMRRILRKIAENEHSNLGDISTLADPSVVTELVENRMNREIGRASCRERVCQYV